MHASRARVFGVRRFIRVGNFARQTYHAAGHRGDDRTHGAARVVGTLERVHEDRVRQHAGEETHVIDFQIDGTQHGYVAHRLHHTDGPSWVFRVTRRHRCRLVVSHRIDVKSQFIHPVE